MQPNSPLMDLNIRSVLVCLCVSQVKEMGHVQLSLTQTSPVQTRLHAGILPLFLCCLLLNPESLCSFCHCSELVSCQRWSRVCIHPSVQMQSGSGNDPLHLRAWIHHLRPRQQRLHRCDPNTLHSCGRSQLNRCPAQNYISHVIFRACPHRDTFSCICKHFG